MPHILSTKHICEKYTLFCVTEKKTKEGYRYISNDFIDIVVVYIFFLIYFYLFIYLFIRIQLHVIDTGPCLHNSLSLLTRQGNKLFPDHFCPICGSLFLKQHI